MQDTSANTPAVSVVMPTYKRPDMITRAVDSVLAQTMTDWELVISDDEKPAGDTWTYLEKIAASDPRIRILQNPGKGGQIPNNNYVMQQARAEWIKPLYDDDAIKPDCLARFLEAAKQKPGAAVVMCLADNFVNNELTRPGQRGAMSALEYLSAEDALLACYLQDLEVGTPVQCMVRREDIQADILWEDPGEMNSAFDTWWLYRLIARGGILLLNEALIDQHWGHETGTTIMQDNPELMDHDLFRLKQLLHPLLPADLNPPTLSTMKQQTRLMRAVLRLRDKQFGQALKLMLQSPSPQAWRNTLSWVRNKRQPGRAPLVARETVWP